MRSVWKDIVFGAIKGFIAGIFIILNYFLLWLFDWLFSDSSFNWVSLLFAIVICFPIITVSLLTLLPKRDHMLKSILIRDASASVTFIISLIISICLSFYWVKGLDQIHYYDFSNATGMVLVMSVFVYLGCLVGTELLIIIAASIVTAIKRNRNKKN